jgi:predicted adenylyl cyclase CyaB
MPLEIELKFKIKNYKEIVKKLLNISKFISSCHERTIMYDNKNKDLFKKDARLRIRKIKNLKKDEETCELSYKKPITRSGIKIEDENEVLVSSFSEIEKLFKKIGFEKISSYERIRDTFEKYGCKITLDSFSFGNFLEIEGRKEVIINIAEKLGFNLKNNITKSCDDIYADLCNKKGEKIKDHLFIDKNFLSTLIQKREFLIK